MTEQRGVTSVKATIVLYCIYIHFNSAPHSMNLSEVLPNTAIDTVSEFTRRNAAGNCK